MLPSQEDLQTAEGSDEEGNEEQHSTGEGTSGVKRREVRSHATRFLALRLFSELPTHACSKSPCTRCASSAACYTVFIIGAQQCPVEL